MTPLPSVSVIIPVLNAERDIRTALSTLLAMDYPRQLLEVIVVDNGSTDRTREVVREFPVTLMVEESASNAYIARNAALPRATGDLVAFTDGDCIIDPQWLRAAVTAMQRENADMVGGNILFTFPAGLSAACIFDSLVHLRNDRSIARRGCAVTANLIVKASLFKVVGLLPDEEPVAGDFIWTANAGALGFKIVYAPDAIVHHPARGLRSLVRKTYSIGRVYAFQRRMAPPLNAGGRPAVRLLWSYVPPNPKFIRKLLHERGAPAMRKKFLSVWLVAYLHSIVWATGALISLAADSRRS